MITKLVLYIVVSISETCDTQFYQRCYYWGTLKLHEAHSPTANSSIIVLVQGCIDALLEL